MEKIIVTGEEMHGTCIERHWINSKGNDVVRRLLTPNEVKMELANEKAGVSDNLLWHGYKHHLVPEKEEWVFYGPIS